MTCLPGETEERLRVISEMVEDFLNTRDMMVTTQQFLLDILSISDIRQEKPTKTPKLIISTDASITKNPGGTAFVGIVINMPGNRLQSFVKRVPSTTSNQAEYDAIYEGITTAFGFNNNPNMDVEVHSDSQMAVKQLRNEMNCNDEKLVNKRDNILELVKTLPVKVDFIWKPRCSTDAMKLADSLAHGAVKGCKTC